MSKEVEHDRPLKQTVRLELPLRPSQDVDFRETSYFVRENAELPSPSEVDARHQTQNPGGRITIFEELNLVVKRGSPQEGRVEEALTIQALHKAFPDGEIPVPEIFGWRIHNGEEFIYMSLIPGISLSKAWHTLNDEDKRSTCDQLGVARAHLMRLSQNTSEDFVGSIIKGPLHDRFFRYEELLADTSGPFESVKAFNDYFQFATLPHIPMAERQFEDPYRHLLPDDCPIRFCHGDMHFGNVMISDDPSQPRKLTGIVDWEEAGWYPEYWDYCKMRLVICEEQESYEEVVGSGGLVDMIFPRRYEDEVEVVGQYWHWRGYP